VHKNVIPSESEESGGMSGAKKHSWRRPPGQIPQLTLGMTQPPTCEEVR